MRKLTLFSVAASMLFSTAVFALDLGSAKNQGLVGETPSGYLASVKAPTPEVKKLMNSINNQRKQKYQSIAKKNGIALKDVEKMAGKKAMQNTHGGHFVKSGGAWKKK